MQVMLARDRTSRVVGRYSTNHLPNWKRWKPHYNITYIAVGEDIVLITHNEITFPIGRVGICTTAPFI
jgi:hypothetical protein